MAPFEAFRAWQEAHRVVLSVYRASESWPSQEQYGLVSQARRAAFFVAANIAEVPPEEDRVSSGGFSIFRWAPLRSSATFCDSLEISVCYPRMSGRRWNGSEIFLESCCGASTKRFAHSLTSSRLPAFPPSRLQ
jgi:23S rRNA-intervening sequence protein